MPDRGYTVTRYDAGGAVQPVGGPATSCSQARPGPVLAGWRGIESNQRPAVTIAVDTTAPTVTVTCFTVADGLGNTKVPAAGSASTTDGDVTVFVCRSTVCTAASAVKINDPAASVPVLAGACTYKCPNLGAGPYYVTAE